MSPDETCAVCGRTILAGERTHGYVSPTGLRAVCELCGARAERLGWRREAEGEPTAPVAPQKHRRGFADLWRRRAKDSAAQDQEPPETEVAIEPSPSPAAPSPDPAAPGARPERLEPQPSLLSPFERAVGRFNGSDAARTVAGLVRTLGAPWVSVGASGGAPKEVRITVAWELSWYQWGVDLGDELRPVFQLDKGFEVDQLDAAARQWNASAVDGRIVLSAPSRQAAPNGEPAGR